MRGQAEVNIPRQLLMDLASLPWLRIPVQFSTAGGFQGATLRAVAHNFPIGKRATSTESHQAS